MALPLPCTVKPYATERSVIVRGWFHVYRGEELIGVVKGEERAQRMARTEDEAERPASAEAPRT